MSYITQPIATSYPLLLASTSPFRQALLAKLSLAFEVAAPNTDETPLPDEAPDALARRLALQKAQALSARYPNHLIIGSDQVAILEGEQATKPGNRERAIAQLRRASGKHMDFHTALAVLHPASNRCSVEVDLCQVYFRLLSEEQIQSYVDREQPYNCAGSFKSEGLGIALFERITGDDPNALVGLPLIRLVHMLKEFGITIP